MEEVKELGVFYEDRRVGTLALYKKYFAAFQYSREWLSDGFSISPLSLPLNEKVFIPELDPFDGLFGVFSDSLPDGWGRLLVDRMLKEKGIDPFNMGIMDRLAVVGDTGMGALSYRPDMKFDDAQSDITLDSLAEECRKILNEEYSEDLDELFRLGGSSGGARPKILTKVDGEDWIIKFPSSHDKADIGVQEYEYSLCARECGIEMEETRLFPSDLCGGYFGTRRFDRKTDNGCIRRIHMISVSALLETSHRIPNLDYDVLMRLTLKLTNSYEEAEKLYRLMCFNVFAHNRDDHSRNFSFLYKEEEQRWVLSPAYDLTYSYSLGGEHATTVHGNGKNPGIDDLISCGTAAGIRKNRAENIAQEIYRCVNDKLGKYRSTP